jgi:FkbM family methyltransferase
MNVNLTATKQCRHGQLTYLRGDTYVGKSLDLYGEWSEGEIVLFRRLLNLGAVVIDAGANIGTHTLALARLVGAAGSVHAIEPQRELYEILCGNVEANSLSNVSTYWAAARADVGTCRLPKINYGLSNNFGAVAVGSGEVEVQQITIDSLNLRSVALIKIDVEGAECEVLEGARNTIKQARPILYVENNLPKRAAELAIMIRDMDYRLWWHLSPYYNPDNFFRNPNNIWPMLFDPYVICLPSEVPPPSWPLQEVLS